MALLRRGGAIPTARQEVNPLSAFSLCGSLPNLTALKKRCECNSKCNTSYDGFVAEHRVAVLAVLEGLAKANPLAFGNAPQVLWTNYVACVGFFCTFLVRLAVNTRGGGWMGEWVIDPLVGCPRNCTLSRRAALSFVVVFFNVVVNAAALRSRRGYV